MVGISSRGRKQGCFQPGPPESSTPRQVLRSSSAMLAKYTGWVAALGRPPVVKGIVLAFYPQARFCAKLDFQVS